MKKQIAVMDGLDRRLCHIAAAAPARHSSQRVGSASVPIRAATASIPCFANSIKRAARTQSSQSGPIGVSRPGRGAPAFSLQNERGHLRKKKPPAVRRERGLRGGTWYKIILVQNSQPGNHKQPALTNSKRTEAARRFLSALQAFPTLRIRNRS